MKMNTHTLQQQEDKFKQDLDYEEWLRYNNPEPTNKELNEMEKVLCNFSILKSSSFNPINTFNYQPPQGA